MMNTTHIVLPASDSPKVSVRKVSSPVQKCFQQALQIVELILYMKTALASEKRNITQSFAKSIRCPLMSRTSKDAVHFFLKVNLKKNKNQNHRESNQHEKKTYELKGLGHISELILKNVRPVAVWIFVLGWTSLGFSGIRDNYVIGLQTTRKCCCADRRSCCQCHQRRREYESVKKDIILAPYNADFVEKYIFSNVSHLHFGRPNELQWPVEPLDSPPHCPSIRCQSGGLSASNNWQFNKPSFHVEFNWGFTHPAGKVAAKHGFWLAEDGRMTIECYNQQHRLQVCHNRITQSHHVC